MFKSIAPRPAYPATLLLLLILPSSLAAQPKVVVSLGPIHSLVSGVMAGTGKPTLLLRGNQPPHGHALKPSQARALERADLVFWVGAGMEQSLAGRLRALATGARAVALSRATGVKLLPLPDGGTDMHIWLDPANARAMVQGVVQALAQFAPPNRSAYRANAKIISNRLKKLENGLTRSLTPLRSKPFLVDHQAYTYLAARFRLNMVGAISLGHEQKPGARRLARLTRLMERRGVVCIMGDWPKPPAMVRSLIGKRPIRTARLDALGSGLSPGTEAYFDLMKGLAGSLRQCLMGPR